MLTHLDWVSFSLALTDPTRTNDEQAAHNAQKEIELFLGDSYPVMGEWGSLIEGKGRKPFSTSYHTEGGELAVYLNHKLSHFVVEFSGTACKRINESEWGAKLLETIRPRVTRIDIACDIETDVNPLDFADARGEGRFKAHGETVSETGTTYYVGSKKSDRYARVYRYNKPHPRHHLLRVEHVFRDDNAKLMLEYYLGHGANAAASQCALMYKWQHEAWSITPASQKELVASRPDRQNANTLYWVYDTIAPLLARLTREGSLDLNEYFNVVLRQARGLDNSFAVDVESGELL